ncbi:50S ribosomal protein L21e [Candidatus Hecatella orcuttiae]|jgi:large subunit ribosomal protein L21e|uniref:50S ribosomal protein L21e n=1 Tax=Candidatus Hecatella orcuttiae TaxID=1935119 RepID=UPI0028681D52|nr:50S ribosomal protein L21e [Candidatus Hecatella orcuttiae]
MKSKGYRSRTRNLLRKPRRSRGLKPLGYLLRKYRTGDKVVLSIDPAVHKGQPHRRYHGKVGVILQQRGRAYVVQVQDGGKTRQIIARPEHLKTFENKV